MNISLLDDAKKDLFWATKFYQSQAFNLGDYFFDSIIADIESLHIYAGIHIKIKGYYRLLSKRFPYAIYYKYDNQNITIYAILDCRSDPNKITQRLK